MHPFLRTTLLFSSGIASVAATTYAGMVVDLRGHLALVDLDGVWLRMTLVQVWQLAVLSTVVSMLLPPAFYGAHLLGHELPHADEWPEHAEFSVFICTFVLVQVLIVTLPENANERTQAFMSGSAYIAPVFVVGFVDGLINAAHVRRLRRGRATRGDKGPARRPGS